MASKRSFHVLFSLWIFSKVLRQIAVELIQRMQRRRLPLLLYISSVVGDGFRRFQDLQFPDGSVLMPSVNPCCGVTECEMLDGSFRKKNDDKTGAQSGCSVLHPT